MFVIMYKEYIRLHDHVRCVGIHMFNVVSNRNVRRRLSHAGHRASLAAFPNSNTHTVPTHPVRSDTHQPFKKQYAAKGTG